MPIQTIAISVRIPEGYEATEEYRPPEAGEPFLLNNISVGATHANDLYGLSINRIILRKLWQPPKCIPDGCWLWKDDSTCRWFISREPRKECGERYALAETFCRIKNETWTPPPDGITEIQVRHTT